MLGADSEVLDPATKPVADRVELHVCAAEAEQLAALLGHQHSAALGLDRLCDRLPGVAGVPAGRHRPRRREEPLVRRQQGVDIDLLGLGYGYLGDGRTLHPPWPRPRALCPSVRGPQRPPGDHENPRDFFPALAIDAPEPARSLQALPDDPFLRRLEREDGGEGPDMAEQADILLGNLEDAVLIDNKVPAREGQIKVAKEADLGDALWTASTRLEPVGSPTTSTATRHRDRRQARGDHGPEGRGPVDIHYVDRLLANSKAKAELDRPAGPRSSRPHRV